jgi:ATP-dependent helicase YprA (DUF1998 family)
MSSRGYTVAGVVNGLRNTLIEYLEAQYHIWNESLLRERRLLLEAPGITSQLPFLEATPSYRYAAGYSALEIPEHAKFILSQCAAIAGTGVYEKPFVHQAKALESLLTRGEQLIIATGTGSGKTESFLLPILSSLAIESNERPASRDLPGMRALLLYPMNALVNDQLARLRRLLGNVDVARNVAGTRASPFRFAMYTSRTPYPGQHDPLRDKGELKPLLESLFGGLSPDDIALLKQEGKWPAKDIDAFIQNDFRTLATDRELFTRQEIQRACPEILITNYSMLEYMLLRPIEASIFEQTKRWLAANENNLLTVVLDEAHMYRGAQGAEVALLLRRFRSRLDIPRERIRFVLTSASFGTSTDSRAAMLRFAEDLTGAGGRPFKIVESERDHKKGAACAEPEVQKALGNFPVEVIQGVLDGDHLKAASDCCQRLALSLNLPFAAHCTTEIQLRDAVYGLCEQLPVAKFLAESITAKTRPFMDIASEAFPEVMGQTQALEALLALVTFAKRPTDDRPFLPVRLHLFFRGLSGIFACINKECSARRHHESGTLLGRLYEFPRLHCECGSRVYEVLTHRDCGASFLRGYLRDTAGDFVWHEPPAHRDTGQPALIESHFLIEGSRDRSVGGAHVWLHATTGRLVATRPAREADYLPVVRAPGLLPKQKHDILSFDRECPVCLREWTGNISRIMDLQTKGEQPFAHLIKTQVQLQPESKHSSVKFPNGGRKSLLFSDGRQKAARLARDIPREIEQDTFRQLLMLAIQNLNALGRDAVPSGTVLYLGFIDAAARQNVSLFDGFDADCMVRHVGEYREYSDADLQTALNDNVDFKPPARYKERLLRQLGAPFYSLFALTLGYVAPKPLIAKRLERRLSPMSKSDVEAVAVIWIQNLLDRFAFDADITASVRNSAAGWRQKWGETTGYRRQQRRYADRLFGSAQNIQDAFFAELTLDKQGVRFLDPNKLCIVSAHERSWYQCATCTFLSPATWSNTCANCGSPSLTTLDFDRSVYLQARKRFWRDPVVRILNGTDRAFALDVQEHTAQLNYRDSENPNSTTEIFERRFRDILVGPTDRPIDVLSCTTTMEVGIDIGSLVAVGLRNVPPQRQNYQQRAGRAGRRGSSVSTVITYAQNNPHDSHYFLSPNAMIAGAPPDPSVDAENTTIISRHVNAQLLQTFFHSQTLLHGASNNITTVLGSTMDFFYGHGQFTIGAFTDWLSSDSGLASLASIENWLPTEQQGTAPALSRKLVADLSNTAPPATTQLVAPLNQFLEFLFSNGFLPSYAFPRHLLALQIERQEGGLVRTVERPQQGLGVALSEYAPGRWVVVNKQTYKVGTVTANCPSSELDRAAPLFAHARKFIQCPNCFHTELDRDLAGTSTECPVCRNGTIARIEIIQPEVAYPSEQGPIDELGDEQVFTEVTSAQLPYPRGGQSLQFAEFGARARIAYGHNEELVMVNRGEASRQGGTGFLVCEKCGKSQLPSAAPTGRHDRDYIIWDPRTRRQPAQCDGQFRPVFLGYTFPTDILVVRIALHSPFNSHYDDPVHRRPLVDATRSLSEALALAASNRLDIDPRELKAGFRFLTIKDERVADLFLYDTLAGGAGYASLAGREFASIAKDTQALLKECACTSSCDKCLRSYENRFFHGSLNRFLALDLLTYAEDGAVPAIPALEAQRSAIAPLAQFLSLEGWDIQRSPAAAHTIKYGAISHQIGTYPSLRDYRDVNRATPSVLNFSDYEIASALPDAAARVSR